MDRLEVYKNGQVFDTLKRRFLTPRIQTFGYIQVRLSIDKKRRYFVVHRLLAEKFIPNPFNLPEVNHINGDKSDNRIENLEWCTPKYNTQHAMRTGLRDNRGEKNSKAKLTDKKVKQIRKEYIPYIITQQRLAKKYKISKTIVARVIRREVWRHVE